MDNINDSESTRPVPGLQMLQLDGLGFFESGYVVDGIYQIVDVIGSGGAGIVYRAEHIMLNQQHALKVLLPAAHTTENWRRFEQEARALAKLDHAGIVKVFNMGFDGNRYPYFAMELVDGISLSDYLQQHGKLPPEVAIDIFLQLTDALRQAHRLGIVHRDIKPGNIMLIEKNKGAGARQAGFAVKLLDFGIARLADDRRVQEKTAAGAVFGTPLYMSPEQGRGEQVDMRSDLYSLGCTFFETLTGSPPFHGGSILETIDLHQRGQLPSLGIAGLVSDQTDDLDTCIQRLLAKEPRRRYQSAEQFAHDLLRIKDGKSISPSILGSYEKSLSALVTGRGEGKERTVKLIALVAIVISVLGLIPILISSTSKMHPSGKSVLKFHNPLRLGAPVKLAQDERFYKGIITEGGRKYHSFFFPEYNASMGKIGVNGGGSLSCTIGAVKLPVSGPLLLWLSNGGEDTLLDARRFAGCPVHGLTVADVDIVRLVEIIKSWPELSFLKIRTAKMSPVEVNALSNLKGLQGLSLETFERRQGDVDLSALATGKLLNRLHSLELLNFQALQPLMPGLRASRSLTSLHFVGCRLTDEELREILKMPVLENLDIDQERLPAAQTLKSLKGNRLKTLRIISTGWTEMDVANLKRINSKFVYFLKDRSHETAESQE